MPEPPRRSVWAALALVTAGALALRLPYLGNQSLWYDETFTRTIAAAPSVTRLWHEVKATEGTPPLYYLLTWGWGKLFGIHSDAALRATSGLAGATCAPAAFLALRRFGGSRAALAATALVAASPMLVWYSLDARAYSLLVLLSLISIWATSLVLERPTPCRFPGWALAAAAVVWTHYFGAFLVVAEVVLLLWRRSSQWASSACAGCRSPSTSPWAWPRSCGWRVTGATRTRIGAGRPASCRAARRSSPPLPSPPWTRPWRPSILAATRSRARCSRTGSWSRSSRHGSAGASSRRSGAAPGSRRGSPPPGRAPITASASWSCGQARLTR